MGIQYENGAMFIVIIILVTIQRVNETLLVLTARNL